MIQAVQGDDRTIWLLPGQTDARPRKHGQRADFVGRRGVVSVAVGQRVKARSLTLALPPVAIGKQHAYLLGQVVCQGAIKASGAQFDGLAAQVVQSVGG
ncbi:hypothetical protein D9M70_522960 [compost metagenome]